MRQPDERPPSELLGEWSQGRLAEYGREALCHKFMPYPYLPGVRCFHVRDEIVHGDAAYQHKFVPFDGE